MNKSRKLVAVRPRSANPETGSGLVGTMFGAVAFLAFVMLATHVLVGLYATSVTTASAFDAARLVATSDGSAQSQNQAEQQLRQQLSSLDNLAFTWQLENDQVGLRVTAQRPTILPPSLLAGTRLTTIDRTVWVRAEVVR